jgi:hypothetical protein
LAILEPKNVLPQQIHPLYLSSFCFCIAILAIVKDVKRITTAPINHEITTPQPLLPLALNIDAFLKNIPTPTTVLIQNNVAPQTPNFFVCIMLFY